MPAKRLRFCRLSLASPTRLSSKPPVMAIAGLKENKYFPNPQRELGNVRAFAQGS